MTRHGDEDARDATSEPKPSTPSRRKRRDRIEADSGLSPVVEQQGGAALANLGRPRAGDLFRD